ncbi:hypothetical protein AAV94_13250 [Lampropedia cohaerens]|uniref:Hydrolase n=1 Tax=Lampropedia cohaerens TaxID=1610491 RepID=A0A0U1PWU0_9BURK|nr:metal-dependent hydrolase [Lampropedia cohaerens]KKW67013.1 hypothetical protein AAV94_13250 [Lampropedia cohaerens]
MDSLSQALLGAAVMAAPLPARQRRKGLAVGAALGTLPDLDTFIVPLFTQSPVDLFTWHRGPSHALWILCLLALAVWAVAWRYSNTVRAAPRGWLLGIALALLSHPLLDAFTVYGTQLWWPSASSPVMWASLFIIDPLYTLPLLVAVVLALIGGAQRWAGHALWWGLALSTLYIAWSLTAQSLIARATRDDLQALGLEDAPRLVINTPANTLLWRIIVLQPDGYAVGYRSLFDGDVPLTLEHYPSETALLAELAPHSADIRRLQWFTSGFTAASVQGRYLVLEDLRMGSERSGYVFGFRVAKNTAAEDAAPEWQVLQPATLAPRQTDLRSRMIAEARSAWQRILPRQGGHH